MCGLHPLVNNTAELGQVKSWNSRNSQEGCFVITAKDICPAILGYPEHVNTLPMSGLFPSLGVPPPEG